MRVPLRTALTGVVVTATVLVGGRAQPPGPPLHRVVAAAETRSV